MDSERGSCTTAQEPERPFRWLAGSTAGRAARLDGVAAEIGAGLHIVQPKCAVTDPEIQEDLEDIKTASSSRNEKRHRE